MKNNYSSSNTLQYIGIDDLHLVFEGCKDVSADWKFLGLALKIKPHTLDAIESDNSRSKDKMLAMLAVWLRRESTTSSLPTWNNLIRAVSDSVGIEEAENIAKNFVCTHV